VPSRTRGGCFAGEAALGVVLALATAFGELVDFDKGTCVAAGSLRANAGVTLLLTFAFGRGLLGTGGSMRLDRRRRS